MTARKRTHIEYGIRKVEGLGYEVHLRGSRWQMAKTLTEARSVRRELERERGEGRTDASRLTLVRYLASWLKQVHQTRSLGTYRAYETVVRQRILADPISRLDLRRMTAQDVQEWVLRLGLLDVSPRTIHKYAECLSAAIHDARKKGVVSRDLMFGVELPRAPKHQPVVYTAEQMTRYLAACAVDVPTAPGPHAMDRPTPTSYALRLIAMTGCRLGEARATTEGDVDLERRMWTIPKSKTASGVRTVPLRPEAVAMFSELIEQYRQDAADWGPHERFGDRWLFRNWDGRQLSPQGILEGHKRIARKAGLPICRVHDLRHAFATHALEAHQDRRVVGKVLGHANEAMTGLYEHAGIALQTAVVDAVASYRAPEKGEVCPTCDGTGRVNTKADAG